MDNKERMIPVGSIRLVDKNNREYGIDYEFDGKRYDIKGVRAESAVFKDLNPGVDRTIYVIFDIPKRRHYYWLKVPGGYWSTTDKYIDLSDVKN